MKKMFLTSLTGALIVFASVSYGGQMGHSTDSHDSMSKEMKHEGKADMSAGMSMNVLHIDGYKVTFHLMDMPAYHSYMKGMKHMNMKMSAGSTHYIMMEIVDKDGKAVNDAVVKIKIVDPEKTSQAKMLSFMMGLYGVDITMKSEGKYQIMTLFKVDGKKHKGGYWYEK